MQAKTTDEGKTVKAQAVMIPEDITIPPMTTKTINAHANHISQFKTTGIITPVEQYTEKTTLLISHSMSTVTNKEVPIRVTNTSESPYTTQEEYPNSRLRRPHSGAIQVHQASRHRSTSNAAELRSRPDNIPQ